MLGVGEAFVNGVVGSLGFGRGAFLAAVSEYWLRAGHPLASAGCFWHRAWCGWRRELVGDARGGLAAPVWFGRRAVSEFWLRRGPARCRVSGVE